MTKESIKLSVFYGMLFLATALSVVPVLHLQNIGFTALTVLLVAFHILWPMAEQDSLTDNHLRYIIKSLWLWNVLVLVGVIVAGMTVSQNMDPTGLEPLFSMMNGAVPVDETSLMQTLENYYYMNEAYILQTTRMCLLPSQLLLVFCLTRGASRAVKGYRISSRGSVQ